MATGVTTSTTLTDFITEEITAALKAVDETPLFAPGGVLHQALRVRDKTAGGGDAADFNVRGSLTAHDVVEGEEYNVSQTLTNTSVNVRAAERQIISYLSDKAMRAMSNEHDQRQEAKEQAEAHVEGHWQKFDDVTMALATSLTSGASSTGADITIANIKAAVQKCRTNNIKGKLFGVLHTEQFLNLAVEASSPWLEIAKSGSIAEQMYEDWQLHNGLGVTWAVSNNAYNDETDVWGMIFNKRCFGCVISLLPGQPEMTHKPKLRAMEISTVADWDVGVVDATQGVYLRTDAP